MVRVCLIGAHGVGKSCMIERIFTGDFLKVYKRDTTLIHGFWFNVSSKKSAIKEMMMCVSDCPDFTTEKDSKMDAAIIMFSFQDKESVEQMGDLYNDFRKKNPDSPVIVVGGKSDVKSEIKISDVQKKYPWANVIVIHSTKNRFHLYLPFTNLVKVLLKDDWALVELKDPRPFEEVFEEELINVNKVPGITMEQFVWFDDEKLEKIYPDALILLTEKFHIGHMDGDLQEIKDWMASNRKKLEEKSLLIKKLKDLFGEIEGLDKWSLEEAKGFVQKMKEECVKTVENKRKPDDANSASPEATQNWWRRLFSSRECTGRQESNPTAALITELLKLTETDESERLHRDRVAVLDAELLRVLTAYRDRPVRYDTEKN